MTLYCATGNRHKLQELTALLPDHHLILPADAGITNFDPGETGATFLENSLIKARALFARVHAPVLADDSGLAVDALDGRPGIYSARYGARRNIPKPDPATQHALLLQEMAGKTPRTARFVCAMTLMLDEYRYITVQETLEGELVPCLAEARGSNGFGYDPIVLVLSQGRKITVAELTDDEKNQLSHRGKAARTLAVVLRAIEPAPEQGMRD